MRTAIYTGTRNVYADMETAAKSLLYHRGADRVIFLIEDDDFPSDLPAQYNVSDWTVRPDGPGVITHYAAVRHWQDRPLWQRYAALDWPGALAGPPGPGPGGAYR